MNDTPTIADRARCERAKDLLAHWVEDQQNSGRKVTAVLLEFDHEDGHVAQIMIGDLSIACKITNAAGNYLTRKYLEQQAAELGLTVTMDSSNNKH